MSRNYSIYSIPAYYTLAMVPHVYSVVLISGKNQRWDNANPKGKKFDETLKKGVPPPVYAQFERCRAAHNNMMSENSAFFIGAVLAGNMAGLDAGYMNRMVSYYLASRVAYIVCYVGITRQRYAYFRTAVFTAGMSILYMVYFKAAGVVATKIAI